MGMNVGRSKGRRYQPMSEINVTPFVDVMLVLLIVFMVTAPLLTVNIPVDLPEASASSAHEKMDPLIVSLKANGTLYLQETEVTHDQLVHQLEQITKRNKGARIYVRGDKKLSYGAIMKVMGCINAAGFSKVALVAEVPKGPKKKG